MQAGDGNGCDGDGDRDCNRDCDVGYDLDDGGDVNHDVDDGWRELVLTLVSQADQMPIKVEEEVNPGPMLNSGYSSGSSTSSTNAAGRKKKKSLNTDKKYLSIQCTGYLKSWPLTKVSDRAGDDGDEPDGDGHDHNAGDQGGSGARDVPRGGGGRPWELHELSCCCRQDSTKLPGDHDEDDNDSLTLWVWGSFWIMLSFKQNVFSSKCLLFKNLCHRQQSKTAWNEGTQLLTE